MFFGMNNEIKEREIIETKTTLETYKTFFVSHWSLVYIPDFLSIY
jgi:hypothetical protein